MKTVLITGVRKGIGRALAEKFLAEKYAVIGTVFSSADSEAPAGLAAVYPLDLSSERSIADGAEAVARAGRKIDILINNAGVLLDEDETAVVVEKLRATLEINLLGLIDFTERIIPLMNAGGHIVNISSSAGSLELTGEASHFLGHYPSYKISKAALNMYTRTLALEQKGRLIISAVHPGWVRTEMGGAEADLSPAEAAAAIFDFAVGQPETGQFWFNGEK